MVYHDIIDPVELARIRTANAEIVYFQDLKKAMIQRINEQWKSKNEIQGSFKNKYYNFEYTILTSYNQTGNRTIQFHNTGKILHDYNYIDIKNWLNNSVL